MSISDLVKLVSQLDISNEGDSTNEAPVLGKRKPMNGDQFRKCTVKEPMLLDLNNKKISSFNSLIKQLAKEIEEVVYVEPEEKILKILIGDIEDETLTQEITNAGGIDEFLRSFH